MKCPYSIAFHRTWEPVTIMALVIRSQSAVARLGSNIAISQTASRLAVCFGARAVNRTDSTAFGSLATPAHQAVFRSSEPDAQVRRRSAGSQIGQGRALLDGACPALTSIPAYTLPFPVDKSARLRLKILPVRRSSSTGSIRSRAPAAPRSRAANCVTQFPQAHTIAAEELMARMHFPGSLSIHRIPAVGANIRGAKRGVGLGGRRSLDEASLRSFALRGPQQSPIWHRVA